MAAIQFQILKRAAGCDARLGRIRTPHGWFDTPAFMPVGTQGAIKGLLPMDIAASGSQIILANAYHLMLRPGSRLISQMGGLHHWMRWQGPLLTDSGGYQVFSLAHRSRVEPDGVWFASHLDGAQVQLTPKRAIEVQNELGADIIMPLDDCPAASGAADDPNGSQRADRAAVRTLDWLDQCVRAHARHQDQALFGIVQGGLDRALRSWCVKRVLEHDLAGYAIGGVAVGERFDQIRTVVEHTAAQLPADKPRYLMGVGYERDLLAAVRAGVDMFDCVLPTRNGRNAQAFTPAGPIRLRNARYAADPLPIDTHCDCAACGGGDNGCARGGPFSRSYLRHLFQAGQMLGPILVSLHNIRHFQRYLLDIRQAILHNDWELLARNWPSSQALAGREGRATVQ